MNSRVGLGLVGPRTDFLRACFKVEPQIYTDLFDPMPDAEVFPSQIVSYLVRKWGERWYLTDRWCLELAELAVLSEWIAHGYSEEPPDVDAFLLAHAVLMRSYPDDSEQAQAALNRFHRMRGFIEYVSLGQPKPFEFRAQWGDRDTRTRFKRELDEYNDNIKKRAARFDKTPEKRNPEHYHWLALNQIKGKSAAAIADSLNNGDRRSREAVKKAIRELRKELGLTRP